MKLKAVPIELKAANKYVEELHRHNAPVHRDKMRVACTDENGNLHGVIQLARPVSRVLDDGETLEIVRCCTDGTKNAASFLYGRAAKIAGLLGYKRVITYTLYSESGVSLRAAGFTIDAENAGGGSWNTPARPREAGDYPTEKKRRWKRILQNDPKEMLQS